MYAAAKYPSYMAVWTCVSVCECYWAVIVTDFLMRAKKILKLLFYPPHRALTVCSYLLVLHTSGYKMFVCVGWKWTITDKNEETTFTTQRKNQERNIFSLIYFLLALTLFQIYHRAAEMRNMLEKKFYLWKKVLCWLWQNIWQNRTCTWWIMTMNVGKSLQIFQTNITCDIWIILLVSYRRDLQMSPIVVQKLIKTVLRSFFINFHKYFFVANVSSKSFH